MAFPRNSLSSFLSHARSSLAKALRGTETVNIVIGNESCDLDSLTSSLLYSYIRSTSPPRNAFSPIYIPLLNIHSHAIRLRPEFTAVCEYAHISPSKLLNLDDLHDGFKMTENVRWILVDHNVLQDNLGKQHSSQVCGVIDHHEDEHAIPQNTSSEPHIIEKCGSCTSVVVHYCRSAWDTISTSSTLSIGAGHGQGESAINDSVFAQGWDAQIAKMALASILIDTANLTAPGKVEVMDREAVAYLEAKIHLSAKDTPGWDRAQFYKKINEAKSDIENLEFDEILVKDYKEWAEDDKILGISSVVKPLSFLVQKAGDQSTFDTAVQNFMQSRNISLFAIMTAYTSRTGVFQRELLLQADSRSAAIAQKFQDHAARSLNLENKAASGIGIGEKSGQIWRKIWQQGDVEKSRKQVAPILREAMRG